MIGGFDKFSNYEVPIITLCNPSAKAIIDNSGRVKLSNAVGILTDTKGTHLRLNYNAPHEISFDYERHISDDPKKQTFYDNIYNGIMTDRYLFVETVGFYIITGVTDSDEEGVDKKSITAQSCEREHENFAGINIKDDTDYQLHTSDNNGLLDLYIANCPNWTIKYIDPVLLYKNGADGEAKVYTFDKIDAEDGYKFLWETIQDGCECIVEPDILTRELSFYSRELYAQNHKTDILVTHHNLLKHRTVEDSEEDQWTALNVLGKDEDLRISMVNPTGMNTLYNFTYRYAWMSPALQEALDKWQAKIDSVENKYYTLVSNYAPQRDVLWNKEEEIKTLEIELEQLEKTKDTIIASKGSRQSTDLTNINTSITNKKKAISSAKSTYNTLKSEIKIKYEDPIEQINSDCRLSIDAKDIDGNTIFTKELLEELASHIKATDYNDEYLGITDTMTWVRKYEIAKQLYDRAKSQMIKLSSCKKTVKIDTASFLFNERFKHFSDQLVAGAIINAEITKDTIEEWLLTGIDIDFDERKTDFTLGNKYDRSDLKSLFDDTLGNHSKTASDLKYLKSLIEEQKKIIRNTTNWLELSRTLTLDNILKSENQEVILNDRGYWGRELQVDADGNPILDSFGNYLYSPEQIKIINNGLYITETNWTPTDDQSGLSVAIGKIYLSEDPNDYVYGVNGKVIMGELFVGQRLQLKGNAAGIKIYNNNNEAVFFADDSGNLRIKGHLESSSGMIGNWSIGDGLYSYEKDKWSINIKVPTAKGGLKPDNSGCVDGSGVILVKDQSDGSFPFILTSDGTVIARKGLIAGWKLNGQRFESGNSTFTAIINAPTAYGNSGADTNFLALRKESDGSFPFIVKSDGTIRASKAEITGGSIGGFTLNSKGFRVENSAFTSIIEAPTTYGSSGDGTNFIVLRNKTGKGTEYPFIVKSNGHVIMEDAVIRGTINSGSTLVNGVKLGTSGNLSIVENNNLTVFRWKEAGNYPFMGFGSDYFGINTSDSVYILMGKNSGELSGNWYIENQTSSSSNAITSDISKKHEIESLSDSYSMFFDNLNPVCYKYNDGTSNRKHSGFIAQSVKDALDVAGISTRDFAGLVIENPNTSDEIWRLRYDEFIALNTWQIQKLKARVIELENKISQILSE